MRVGQAVWKATPRKDEPAWCFDRAGQVAGAENILKHKCFYLVYVPRYELRSDADPESNIMKAERNAPRAARPRIPVN
jgi:hypothetical protein